MSLVKLNFDTNKLLKEFIVEADPPKYKHKFGHLIASSLSGFITGAGVASIIWYVFIRLPR
ncbi:MAG: hypothetical protein M1505_00310 [Patescibacteria group bacterium]|nr:hypothetical protein [Patescibacteria group bacterium]MCL5257674.1 hypothetical protein [Patescibacteria group bacterium]